MQAVSVAPFRVMAFPWRTVHGGHALTVVCKATCELRPTGLRLAEHQEDLNEEDNYWDDDPRRSLYSPTDRVPFKTRADVVLVGRAYAPKTGPVRSLLVRLALSTVDKSIEVWGDRAWSPEGGMQDAALFTSMPLRYEHAAAGPDNPVGKRGDGRGPTMLPNIGSPGTRASTGGEPAVGLGPIAPQWPSRAGTLGRHRPSFTSHAWEQRPLPEDFDASFFNVAPLDQRLERIQAGDLLVLEHLLSSQPRYSAEIPDLRPRAFVDRGGNDLEELALTCDTLWIDTDRAVCTLTWRGQLGLNDPGDPGLVFIVDAPPGEPLGWPQIHEQWRAAIELAHEHTSSVDDEDVLGATEGPRPPSSKAELPFASDAVWDESTSYGAAPKADTGAALPFVKASASEASPPRSSPAGAPPPWLDPRTTSPVTPPALLGALLVPGAPPARSTQAIQRPAPVAPPLPPPPPSLGTMTPSAEPPPLRPPPADPWRDSGVVSPPAPPPRPSQVGPLPPSIEAGGNLGSVLTASNVAASVVASASAAPAESATPASAPAKTSKAPPAELLLLLWFDPEALAPVRLNVPWQELLGRIQLPRPDVDYPDDPVSIPQDVKDRNDIFGVLAQARPTGEGELDALAAEATSPEGRFEAPLAVVAGELTPAFEEMETLKATLAAVAPFAGGDKKLKEAFDAAVEALKSPYMEASSKAAEGLSARLREAFGQSSRALPPGYLDGQVERLLVEQRRYQRRTVLGEPRIRTLLAQSGGAPVPVYLPEPLAARLPLYARFQARLIVEVHLQQDQYETHPYALKALALARAVRPVTRGGRA